ncbi:MAG: S41 family peptidase [Firmicutes bacterium]|nr:S41 family peptidase [Bacillota bacterium]
MKFKRITTAVLAAVIAASGTVFAAAETETENETEYSGEYIAFDQIAGYIAERYIDETYTKDYIMAQGLSKLLEDDNPLLIQLLKATLESLDDYSEFYTAEEYKAFQDNIENTYYGIGIVMAMSDDGYVEILSFAEEDSKAEKAGFKIGDKIYKVDGVDVTGWSMEQVRSVIIGEENTTVNITVLRDGEEIELMTTRVATIQQATVSGGILNGNIGYIQIETFSSATSDEFAEMLDIMRDNNVENIIIDLRNNGGGVVSSAVGIAQQIVPEGKIIDVEYRQSEYNITYNSDLAEKEFDFIVLVNENTASSSEILASAVQDSGAGILVGTTTFGKAVIQNMYPLTNGSVFKITVAQYITRNGSEINHVGLTPDEEIENETSKIDTSNYTSFDYETKPSYGSSGDNVKSAKEKLSVLGFYDGDSSSGIFDEELKEAVKDFQREHSLFPYGILDIATQVKIDEVFSDIDVVTDNQLITAYEMFGGSKENLYVSE